MKADLEKPSQATYSFPTQAWTWKWEKKHWLLLLAVGCLVLWWFSSQFATATWWQNFTNYLPLIGSTAFALEAITKLVHGES